MYTIEVDFEVFKELTSRRQSEAVSNNDVLRALLSLGSKRASLPGKPEGEPPESWTTKGVTFVPGTEFRAKYRGQTYLAKVSKGAMIVDGKRFESPSAAACAITGNSVNGWTFWEYRSPGSAAWRLLKSAR